MIPIFIPSRSRAHQFKSEFCTIKSFPYDIQANTTYVVPDGEEDSYVFELPQAIKVLTLKYKYLAQKRSWIGRIASTRGYPYFIMVDDDVKFYTRLSPENTTLRPSGSEDIRDMLAAIEQCFVEGYDHVGISARQGNNNVGVGGPPLREDTVRTFRFLAYRTNSFLACKHDRVHSMDDFDIHLQLLELGFKTCNLFYWSQDHPGTNIKGGCSDYRNHETHAEDCQRLHELHPDFVRLVDKKNKTGGEFGQRTEVHISWKKAAESYANNQRTISDGSVGTGAQPD